MAGAQSNLLSKGDIVSEHFDTYSSTANMLSDPRGIYIPSDDVNTAQIVLDKTVGDTANGLTQSCRIDYPNQPSNCADYTTTRSLAFPSDVVEVWVRTRVLWQANWTNDNRSNCQPSPPNIDYKFQFIGVRTAGRYNIMVGTNINKNYTVGYPGGEDNFEGGTVTEWDGTAHTYWWHCKNGASGSCAFARDSTIIKDYGVVNTSSGGNLYKLTFPRNINMGPPQAQSVWLLALDVFSTQPAGSPV